MLPSYKRVLLITDGDRCRGRCIVIVGLDGERPQFCNSEATGAVSQQHQLCYAHLHGPAIFREDEQNEGFGSVMRYCQHMACKRLRPLEDFRGFSPVCLQHERGRGADGGAPSVVAGVERQPAAAMVVTRALPLQTLAAGAYGDPKAHPLRTCDVVGCTKGVKGGCITHAMTTRRCAQHVHVSACLRWWLYALTLPPPM